MHFEALRVAPGSKTMSPVLRLASSSSRETETCRSAVRRRGLDITSTSNCPLSQYPLESYDCTRKSSNSRQKLLLLCFAPLTRTLCCPVTLDSWRQLLGTPNRHTTDTAA